MRTVRTGERVARADVPSTRLEELQDSIAARIDAGGRVSALFATATELWAAVADPVQSVVHLGRAPIGPTFPSLTPRVPAVHLFEREIREQRGFVAEGHPGLEPVRFVGGAVGERRWYRVEGDEVHEVGVGPVHAGVIEPGHFRFQCHGEEVLHLEISLGYQHRGVERALVGPIGKRTLHYVETLAGDSTVAHATAYVELVEGLAGIEAPARAVALRGVALELERLANHTGDLGALAGDVGYLPTASYCGRLRGDWLNLTAELCGNRFGRSFVAPGGVRSPVDPARAGRMIGKIDAAMADLRPSIQLLWDNVGVMSRFEDTGRVDAGVARSIGLVGVAARAAGLPIDARVDFPSGIWRYEQVPISGWSSGDVFGRAWVRALEVERSAAFARARLEQLPDGPERVPAGPLAADSVAVALVEGWRGEVCHVALTGSQGELEVYKVVDPSFHNWLGLALALRGQQISDFPLCNKSFNLSYCGHDL